MGFRTLTVTSREAEPALAAEMHVPNSSKKLAFFEFLELRNRVAESREKVLASLKIPLTEFSILLIGFNWL